MFCKYCGKEIEEGSIFCEFCGKKQITKNLKTEEAPKAAKRPEPQASPQPVPKSSDLGKKKWLILVPVILILVFIGVYFLKERLGNGSGGLTRPPIEADEEGIEPEGIGITPEEETKGIEMKPEEEPEEPMQKFCSQCGKPYKPGTRFCSRCGNKLL